jgi:RimJ/RimL family protein N-acetyltransferase
MRVPVLESGRLILRAHKLEDFEALSAMWADPLVTRHIGGRPFTEEESWARLLRYAGHWHLFQFGYWVIEEKTSGAFAGEIGFANHKRGLEPSIDGMPEMGWALTSRVHGKGYATEAGRAVLTWGDANLGAPRTASLIHPMNAPSIRVAEKLGYRESHRATYKELPAIVFVR